MFAYLNGKITYKTPTHVYLDCNGVGYFVNISLTTFSQIENTSTVKLFTHLVVREDAHVLYGFFSEEEKNMFLHLISQIGTTINFRTKRQIKKRTVTGRNGHSIAAWKSICDYR